MEQDKEKAKAWYAKAAKQGDAGAMAALSGVLLETEGAAAMPTIMTLLRAAAEKGYAKAKQRLPTYEEWILSSCASCGKHRAAMAEDPKRCNRCSAVAYCSAACQKQHWKRGGHKVACNERMKYLPEEEEEEE